MKNIKKPILAGILVLCWAGAAQAACRQFSDKSGNTTIICDDGTSGHTYTDAYGNTSGRVGNQNINIHTDRNGNTTGNVGDKSVQTYKDPYGNTTGRVGDKPVNTYTDPYGNTTGTVGNKPQYCFADAYGNRTCQ